MSGSSVSSICNSLSADPEEPIERAKKAAAFACGEAYIRNGQKIGVGSGSTVKYFVEFLKERYQTGKLKDIVCVPTSFMTRKWLLDANLPVSTLEQHYVLDIDIDGADEVDAKLNLIKGGGGCLTQEKIVQSCAKKFIVIADDKKKSKQLGENYKNIPIEVVPAAYVPVKKWIEELLGGECTLRIASTKCSPLITDNGNYILQWDFPKDAADRDWKTTNQMIRELPGVVETGLFLNVVEKVYLATHDGKIEVLEN
uniref:Ribose-5-phosphate isomerase n=1 Tax=Panagrolaimus sp. PS1159 TaxID=55785 RepID=A0AC35FIR8_9BILA